MSDLYPRIYACIRAIPAGRVASYGQIANLVGCGPRQVGYSLAALKDKETDIPWHRIVNRDGKISLRDGRCYSLQRIRLEAEGVAFTPSGKIDLTNYGWTPSG